MTFETDRSAAADDGLAILAQRVRELAAQVRILQTELEDMNKRLTAQEEIVRTEFRTMRANAAGRAAAPESAQAPAERAHDEGTGLQLTLAPVPSFPRLVDIERRIQSLPAVRSLYVRDFRNGIATLAVGLRTTMSSDDFGRTLSSLEQPRFRVLSSTRNSLELRLEGDVAAS